MPTIAILCGGKGTRAGLPINKCFVDVNSKPMILRIMEQLEDQGFTTFILCRGDDGTLTALRNARDQLGDRFIVVYGDTYLPIQYDRFIKQWDNSQQPAITAFREGIDAGVNGFSSWMLDMMDENETSLAKLQLELRSRGLVSYFIAEHPWCEVGTPEALAKTRATLI